MTYIRGDVAEVDAWEQLGNPGWNWGSLLPYYKKSEGYINPDAGQLAAGVTYDPRYHGCGGPVHVGYPATLRNGSFAPVIMDTWEVALSMELNPDVNGGRVRGLSVGPQTMDPEAHLRYDAARAYYYPVERRPNLKILRGTVKRIVWLPPPSSRPGCDADRLVARGVEVLADDGATSVVYATREVIISAGAVRTPLVLEASGVGNPRFVHLKLCRGFILMSLTRADQDSRSAGDRDCH
jgi:choline dehydrogenase